MRNLLSLSLLAACLSIGDASAEVPSAVARALCHDYKELVTQLGSKYEEAPVSIGVQSNGHLLQVFSSPRNGTWTILSISPEGQGCVVAAGRGWENLKPPILDPEA